MDRITFKVNGIEKSVGNEVSSDQSLLDYLRIKQELRGTKYMCREGGCGACIVSVVKKPGAPVTAVNSCLVSVTSCNEWDVTTVEKVGNRRDGYHPLQITLAAENGTQCGHCTPGWIMAMYSLLKSKPGLTRAEIEKSFASNICRCTGYRPILEAFKKFAIDAPALDRIMDIEDLNICQKSGRKCKKSLCEEADWCILGESDLKKDELISVLLKDGKSWYIAKNIDQVFQVMPKSDDYMLVAGNTAKGVHHIIEYPNTLIDVTDVEELKLREMDQNLIVGAGHTLTELIEICKETAEEDGFSYLSQVSNHLELVAHIAVRNLGSIAGNLMIKHRHKGFSSDIFLLLTTVRAQISITDRLRRVQLVKMEDFLNFDMSQKVILNVLLPPLGSEHQVLTYKIMPRAQNAHAIVNAGFNYKLDSNNKVKEVTMAFGGISPTFVRAKLAENFLIGKELFKNETVQGVIKVLKMDLVTDDKPIEKSGEYRQKLAIGLFYKSVLKLCPPDKIHARYVTGATELRYTRPVSSGEQTYHTDPSTWPLNKPMPKVEALIQCAGEAHYTDDIPALPHEVHAAFVLSTIASGHISSIDATAALALPGVIAFYKASDIPKSNNYDVLSLPMPGLNQKFHKEVFSSGEIQYRDQAIGVIVAETFELANQAAKLVNVKYTNVKLPILDIETAKLDDARVLPGQIKPATDRGIDVSKTIKGNLKLEGQYHFPMESINCVAKPTDFGLEVHIGSQWVDHAQKGISQSLGIDQSNIDVVVTRLGGAFGLKLITPSQIAVTCSLVTHLLQRPCRLIVPLSTVTRMIGKRFPNTLDYEMELDESGKIQYVKYHSNANHGSSYNEVIYLGNPLYESYYNVYNQERFDFKFDAIQTDNPANISCRGPGSLEGVAFAELLMERIATEMSLDPLEVRLANVDDDRIDDIQAMIDRVKKDSDFEKRKKNVNTFNQNNRWKKRGLRYSLSKFVSVGIQKMDVNLSVFAEDGTVSITHGGIEMGQGVNTKAIQIAAHLLKIPTDTIKIKSYNSNSAPNSSPSGGSAITATVVTGVKKCCEDLLEKLAPFRLLLPDDVKWKDLVNAANKSSVDLQTHSFVTSADGKKYDVYGVVATEVEIDVLTGEMQIVRVDLLQDVGRSINPSLDIGQIEGAFIMGVGYWTSEELVYDKVSGELLSDRTWNYKVPQALDIPQDFRIYFRKNSANDGVFGSKVIGEPPICLSVSVPIAMREAITAARLDSGIPSTTWFDIDGPYTVEKTCLSTATDTSDFKLY